MQVWVPPCIGGWVDPRVCLDIGAKTEIPTYIGKLTKLPSL